MIPIYITYENQLRSRAVHGPSTKELITDAPTDNHGRGETFSPTDLFATALGSCMSTMMGIAAEPRGIRLDGTKIYVEKHMSSDPPRRVAKLVVRIDMIAGIKNEFRPILKTTVETCPVIKSIHPDIVVDLRINYPD